MSRFPFPLFVLFIFLGGAAIAQSPNGTISGLVLDPSGQVISDADILIMNDVTGVKYGRQTNREGIYTLSDLPPGPYRIQVSKIGFKTLIKPDVSLHVQDALAINFTLPLGAVSETITVRGGAPLVNTESGSVSTVIGSNWIDSLPMNGRSFNTLLQLTPGVVIAPSSLGAPGQFSVSGQRTDANNLTVDGVSGNFGVSTGGNAGQSGTGGSPAFSALGGTSSLVSVEALQEFRIGTSSFAPEFGKTPGGQIALTTKSGTNALHGGVYEYFRNDVMDANDWFANQAGLPRPEERHNDFGGFLGGPMWRDRTFFFLSYEGARLRLPQTQVIQVPSETSRASASPGLSPFLAAYPKPNGPVSPAGFTAQFTGAYSNKGSLDATSLRVDHVVNHALSLFVRYNDAPSEIIRRQNALSVVNTTTVDTQTVTAGLNLQPSSHVTNSLRGNYSTQRSKEVFTLDNFGGAVPLNANVLLGNLPTASNVGEFFTSDTGAVLTGPYVRNRTQQTDFSDDLAATEAAHGLKFGVDYRSIKLTSAPFLHLVELSSPMLQEVVNQQTMNLYAETQLNAAIISRSLSLYAQDTWKLTPRLTLVYGLRWELTPAPSAGNGTKLASWINGNDPTKLSLAPIGTPLWATRYGNLAPRIGFAYGLNENADFVLKGGAGIFFDLGLGSAADLTAEFPNVASVSQSNVAVPVANPAAFLPTVSLTPPYPGYLEGFVSTMRVPRSYQWNLALEKAIAGQTFSATYVGQAGRGLLRQAALFAPNSNFAGDIALTDNGAWSNYHALQLQYRRPLAHGLQALASYTWSHSLDNTSNDVVAGLPSNIISATSDYASSDFDVRHSFSATMICSTPSESKVGLRSIVTRDWSLALVAVARSGFPFNAQVFSPSPDLGGVAASRPDLVSSQPVWVADRVAPGGRMLNINAFSVPSTVRQGTEPRNNIPGFGLTQIDVSLRRRIPITERLHLEFAADAFNLLNHPNFTNPIASIEFGPFYLQSEGMLNQTLGGLNPLFQEGGPRSLQLSLRLSF